ncbi:MAG TPA: ABC transporter substrate-binding protein [Stellaceae bacterium]|nr:ABC transporter substrate-binding protein [Stellaceae bacterium]
MFRTWRGAALIFAAVAIFGSTAGIARAAADTADFDVVLPLTGGGAFLGGTQKQNIEQTEKVINREGGLHGKPIRFVFHDDQTSPQLAVQLTTDIVANHPAVVFGSTISAICNAMTPLMQKGPVHYCFSPSVRPVTGGFEFTSQIASRDQQRALLTYFRAKGWTRIALITTTDASGQDADKSFNDLVKLPEFSDINLVEDTHFNPSDVSITAQMARIAAANPQVVISWATAAAGATVFRGLVQAGLDLPVAASGSNMTYGQMTDYAAFLPKQLFFGVSAWAAHGQAGLDLPQGVLDEQKKFFAAMAAAGLHVDASADIGWDTERIVISALNKLPPGADAAQLHDYLEHLSGYQGIDGIYDFVKVPQRGLDVSNAIVVRWDKGAKDWLPASKLTGIPLTQ